MKKLFFLFLLSGAANLTAQVATTTSIPENSVARKVAPEDVPNLIVKNFNDHVSNITPSWTDNGQNYVASYVDTLNFARIVTYDRNGNLLNIQDEQGRTAYPAAIERYHDKYYPNEKFTVWLNTDASGNKTYYFTRNTETVWFDPKGSFVQKSDNMKVKP